MIQLTENAIMLVNDDGTKTAFEIDELQSRIIKSSLAAGMRDVAFAEDIALAIEYALSKGGETASGYTLEDIDAVVVRALRGAGYPRIANHYEKENGVSEGHVRNEEAAIQAILETHLALTGKTLTSTVGRVRAALDTLGVDQLSPTLALELGKHYKQSTPSSPVPPIRESGRALSIQDLLDLVPDVATRWIDLGALRVHAVSDLFPTLKIDVDLKMFATASGLTPPFTEMALNPLSPTLSAAINALAGGVAKRNATFAEKPLIYLRFVEMEAFASECLGGVWPESKPLCEEIAAALVEGVNGDVFKTVFV